MKILNMLRTVSFIATLLTTIPLFINYLMGNPPAHQMIVHLHVWFGLAFFILGITSMILMKKDKKS
ncbi:MAG: hypothetical protein DRP93_00890 [Candidatus Neomarinimicrobiota bacterium]|nr:MAG: hypothetical protein DRP93_00890 [Candidatus Neomarinimicrobiota bacterium]